MGGTEPTDAVAGAGAAAGEGAEPQDAVPEGWAGASPELAAPDAVLTPGEWRRQVWRARGTALASALLGTAVTGVLVWALLPEPPAHSSSAPPSPSASASVSPSAAATVSPSTGGSASPSPSASGPDLTAPDRVRNIVDSLERRTGGTEVYYFSVSEQFSWITVPVDGGTGESARYEYRSGSGLRGLGATSRERAGRPRFDLADIDRAVLPDLYRRADEALGFRTATERTLRVDPRKTPVLSVELDDGASIGWIDADLDGTVTEVHPRVRYAFGTPTG
ncbi:hypothetical protein [Streptomyces tendae]|uniref:hypothetical protein n=1 Tax=Streptomyces tendae TaxID=1932 RepID=UPI002492DF59|nr:hypothetical protein [Streptomyces tendae]